MLRAKGLVFGPECFAIQVLSRIPDSLTNLIVGNEVQIEKEGVSKTEPLFKDKNWLWAVMAIIMILLGWFSVKMIKSK